MVHLVALLVALGALIVSTNRATQPVGRSPDNSNIHSCFIFLQRPLFLKLRMTWLGHPYWRGGGFAFVLGMFGLLRIHPSPSVSPHPAMRELSR